MTVTELIKALTELGVEVAGPAAIIDADTAQAVREMYGPQTGDKKYIDFPSGGTVKDLATAMGMTAPDLQKRLMSMGVLAAVNQRLSPDAAKKIAGAHGFAVRIKLPEPAALPEQR